MHGKRASRPRLTPSQFLVAALACALLSAVVPSASAATFRVCLGCPYSTVAAAVNVSSPGDTIVITGDLTNQQPVVVVRWPLTLASQAGATSRVEPASATEAWLQVRSNLTIAAKLAIAGAPGLLVQTGGLVVQTGIFSVSHSQRSGVEVASGARFQQDGSLSVTGVNGSIGIAVFGEWTQTGAVAVTIQGAPKSQSLLSVATAYYTTGIINQGGRWVQNGSVTVSTSHRGITITRIAEWLQSEPVRINGTATVVYGSDLTSASITIHQSRWVQNARTDVVASTFAGVFLTNTNPPNRISLWEQNELITINCVLNAIGVISRANSTYWTQNGDVAISLNPTSLQPFNCTALTLWKVQSGNTTVNSAAQYDLGGCVRTQSVPASAPPAGDNAANTTQPILRFDSATNAIQIVPKASSESAGSELKPVEEAAIQLAFASITEVSGVNGESLQTGRAAFGAWEMLPANELNASQAFRFTSPIAFDQDSRVEGSVELRVFLFDESTNVSIGDLASFTVLPSFTKISIAVAQWPWTSTASRLEVRLGVSPPFTSVGHGASDQTSAVLKLEGQRSSDGKRSLTTEARFVSVVELDGVLEQPAGDGDTTRAPVEFAAEPATSSLVLSFRYFASNMSYDPDLSVLVGKRDDGSNGAAGDNNAWIIAVAVAVPVAVVVVLAVIVGATIALAVKRRRRNATLKAALAAHAEEL